MHQTKAFFALKSWLSICLTLALFTSPIDPSLTAEAALTILGTKGSCSCDNAMTSLNCSSLGISPSNLLSALNDTMFQAACPNTVLLDFSNNNITNIPVGTFSNSPSLVILSLSNNALTSIPEVAFSNLPSLETLYLDNNVIDNIPKEAFSNLTKLNFLSLHSNAITSIPEGAFSNLPSLSTLFLFNNVITSLPKGAFSNLLSLSSLSLNNNEITNIPEGAFSNLLHLFRISLQSNAITSIPEGAFSNLPSLDALYLHKNAIKSIPKGAFSNLSSLAFLSLHNNEITSIPDGAFSNLPSLITLYLYGNAITSIPVAAFSNLPSLVTLGLYSNAITSIPDGAFSNLPSLVTLYFYKNALTSIPVGVYSNLTKLNFLSLYSNSITSIPVGVFSHLTKLNFLDLSSNAITSIPEGAFSNLPSLDTLDLSNNAITSISEGAFSNLPSLDTLDLSNNAITRIVEGAFSNLPSLGTLDLSNNAITSIVEGAFSNLPSLGTLYLYDNAITSIPGGAFSNLPSLTTLIMTSNPLNCFMMNNSLVTCKCSIGFTGNTQPTFCVNSTYLCNTSDIQASHAPWIYQGRGVEYLLPQDPPVQVYCNLSQTLTRNVFCLSLGHWSLCNAGNSSCLDSLPASLRSDPFSGCETAGDLPLSASSSVSVTSILLIAFGAVVGILILALLIAAVNYMRNKRQAHKIQSGHEFQRLSALQRRAKALLLRTGGLGAFSTDEDESAEEELSTNDYPLSAIHLHTVLGSGVSGIVHLGMLDVDGASGRALGRAKEIQCAVKLCKNNEDPEAEVRLLCECKLLALLRHPHIVRLIGICSEASPLMMVMEYLPRGNLRDYLRSASHDAIDKPATKPEATPPQGQWDRKQETQEPPPSTEQLVSYAHQICSAMQFLERHKILHRDLACRNVLVGDNHRIKLADFGLSRWLDGSDYYRQVSQEMMPLKWMAPEAIEDHKYTSKSDVWSFGITMWEIMSHGETPYAQLAAHEAVARVKGGLRLSSPVGCPAVIYQMMERCWNEEPRLRPSFAELLPLLQGKLQLDATSKDQGQWNLFNGGQRDFMSTREHEAPLRTNGDLPSRVHRVQTTANNHHMNAMMETTSSSSIQPFMILEQSPDPDAQPMREVARNNAYTLTFDDYDDEEEAAL